MADRSLDGLKLNNQKMYDEKPGQTVYMMVDESLN